MTQTAVDLRVKRVLLAIDATSRGAGLMESAAILASGLNAPLHALFIEDANLLRAAALPFAREIGRASAAAHPMNFPDLERYFRRQSALAEQLLVEIAARLQVSCSFQVTRGLPVAALMNLACATDLILFGQIDHAKREGPIMVLFDSSPPARHALVVAAQLADTTAKPLSLALPLHLATKLEKAAMEALQDFNGRIIFQHLPQTGALELAHAARNAQASALVLGVPQPLNNQDIRSLREHLGCPLALIA